LAPCLPQRGGLAAGWTASAPLPGGEFGIDDFDAQVSGLRRTFPFLDPRQATRLVRAYGTHAKTILGSARTAADLGTAFGASLSEAEVRYLMEHEWARTAEDVVWRRTKLGLRMTPGEIGALDAWMRGAGAARAV
jgi:glycerol-3-phosphate dehydrogenase